MGRPLRGLRVAPGVPGVADVRRALTSALDGGPAFAPVAAGAGAADTLLRLRADDPAAPLEHDDVAVVVTTSGSTGAPRGVLITRAGLVAAGEAAAARAAPGACWLLALPVTSVGGLMVLVRSWVAGTRPEVWPGVGGAGRFDVESFAPAARTTLSTARSAGRAAATSLVPTQLARICDAGGESLDLLASFELVLVGGSALPDPLRTRASAAGVPVVSTYGATETAGGVVWDGLALPGVQLRVGAAEPDDGRGARAACEEDGSGGGPAAGPLLVGGPTVAVGYRLEPEASAASFVGGWWRTGDVACRNGERWAVTGRVDDVVKVGGVKVSLPAVERAVLSVPGIAEAVVVAVPDAEWGVVPVAHVVLTAAVGGDAQTPAVSASLVDQLRARVERDLGRAAVPRRVVRHDALPMLPNGKVDKAACRDPQLSGYRDMRATE